MVFMDIIINRESHPIVCAFFAFLCVYFVLYASGKMALVMASLINNRHKWAYFMVASLCHFNFETDPCAGRNAKFTINYRSIYIDYILFNTIQIFTDGKSLSSGIVMRLEPRQKSLILSTHDSKSGLITSVCRCLRYACLYSALTQFGIFGHEATRIMLFYVNLPIGDLHCCAAHSN